MIKRLRKGFTLVELVIVIAVIAVLAAVLIPTFSDMIKKAQNSADLQEARNLYSEALIEDPTITSETLYIKVGEGDKVGYVKFENGQPKEVVKDGKIEKGDYTEDSVPEEYLPGSGAFANVYRTKNNNNAGSGDNTGGNNQGGTGDNTGDATENTCEHLTFENGECIVCGAKHYICGTDCPKGENKVLLDSELVADPSSGYGGLIIYVCPDCNQGIIACEPGCDFCGKNSDTDGGNPTHEHNECSTCGGCTAEDCDGDSKCPGHEDDPDQTIDLTTLQQYHCWACGQIVVFEKTNLEELIELSTYKYGGEVKLQCKYCSNSPNYLVEDSSVTISINIKPVKYICYDNLYEKCNKTVSLTDLQLYYLVQTDEYTAIKTFSKITLRCNKPKCSQVLYTEEEFNALPKPDLDTIYHYVCDNTDCTFTVDLNIRQFNSLKNHTSDEKTEHYCPVCISGKIRKTDTIANDDCCEDISDSITITLKCNTAGCHEEEKTLKQHIEDFLYNKQYTITKINNVPYIQCEDNRNLGHYYRLIEKDFNASEDPTNCQHSSVTNNGDQCSCEAYIYYCDSSNLIKTASELSGTSDKHCIIILNKVKEVAI